MVEHHFAIRTIQTTGPNRHAVFFTHPLETLTYHYERNPADPRTQHAITLDVDDYGNVLKDVAIGYGRRAADPDLPTETDRAKQTTPLITYTEHTLTNPIDGTNPDGTTKYPADHRTPLPAETRTHELTGFSPQPSATRFTRSDFVTDHLDETVRLVDTGRVKYEQTPPAGKQRRLLRHVSTFYRPDDFGAAAGSALALLPLGQMESRALVGESYKLAFTQGLLTTVFTRDGTDLLGDDAPKVLGGVGPDQGGYRSSSNLKAAGLFPIEDADGDWWIPSGRSFLSPARDDANPAAEQAYAVANFYLPQRFRTPFHTEQAQTETIVGYDNTPTPDGASINNLLVVDVQSPSAVDGIPGNRVTAADRRADGTVGAWQIDYRVLRHTLVSDPNRDRTQVVFDTLGLVVGTAVKGKPEPVEGDNLDNFVPDLTQAQTNSLFDDGNPYPAAPNLLQSASTRIVYDLHRFTSTREAHPNTQSLWLPAGVVTLARETHATDPLPPAGKLRIHLSYSYSDGSGREIQKKIPAEKGPVVDGGPDVDPRWVGSGWTILNNKGKPVRQYEPFFTPTHTFEFAAIHGVSSVLFYDPPGRVIATLYPNNTYSKVVADPWKQVTFDANDTSAPSPTHPAAQPGDPRTDPDIATFVAEYFAHRPDAATWQTWYTQRVTGGLGVDEQTAAARAAAHTDTPTTSHFDTLGRPFLVQTVNRVVCPGHPEDGEPDDVLSNRVQLDIEGNQRAVRDADQQGGDRLGRIVMRYDYNMLGARIHQESMEAGQRRTLADITGKPLRAWDSRGHTHTTTYDRVRRPVGVTVRGTTPDSDPRTLGATPIMVEKIDYGDTQTDFTPDLLNLRGRVYRHYDSAGLVTNAQLDATGNPRAAYDFKGNLLYTTRRLATDYKNIPDWSGNAELDEETFESRTWFDALNRITQALAPHSNQPQATITVTQPRYNPAGLLETLDVWLDTTEPTQLLNPTTTPPTDGVGVHFIGYDAKGQRQRIDYKNTATTRYWYDPATFRLTHLYTHRGPTFTDDCPTYHLPPPGIAAPDTPPDGVACGIQNLHYTYDPAGNITHIHDSAQQRVFFRNQVVDPSNDYTYDAIYRLIQSTGREHLGQTPAGTPNPPAYPDPFTAGLDPNDDQVMGTYTETYVYDTCGNHLSVKHTGSQPAQAGWTLTYTYGETSPIENGNSPTTLKHNNRLTQTSLDPNDGHNPRHYLYDLAGNTTYMPHLGDGSSTLNMIWDHQDRLRQVDRGGAGQVHYLYDSAGQRVRKIWEKSAGVIEERIYLGGFEIYRRYPGPMPTSAVVLERDTLHIMDDQRRIALIETRTLDTAGNDRAARQLIRYQHGNHLDSSTVELDEQAQLISYEEYAPYGISTYQASRNKLETSRRYRYTSKERDEETGMYYFGARYYAPWLARWTSYDPAVLARGLNSYSFVRNDPVGLHDPTGAEDRPTRNVSTTDPSDPLNYGSFEHYRAAQPMVLSDDELRARWEASQPGLGGMTGSTGTSSVGSVGAVASEASDAEPVVRARDRGAVGPTRIKEIEEFVFSIRHPVVASEVGDVQRSPGTFVTNISTVASRLASRTGLDNTTPLPGEGTEVNAMRHTIWQALISGKYGTDIAKKIGGAHEETPFINRDVSDFSSRRFESSSLADSSADLLNNEIGRQIGSANPTATPRDIASIALDYYHDKGLWMVFKQSDGTWRVQQVRLSDEKYEKAKANLRGVDDFGFTPEQQKMREAQIERDKEASRRGLAAHGLQPLRR